MHLSFAKTCFVLVAAFATSLAVADADADSISIARASGSIAATTNGVKIAVRVGARLTPPVTIQTGADGTLHLDQSTASLDIGPNTFIELHDSLATARIVQRAGRVMYTVEPRKSRDFAVETPYLVSVVKGTIFTVSVERDSTQVTLLEGSVELRGDGIADPVLLQPNQSAKRVAGERTINVTNVDTKAPTQANLDRSQPTALSGLTATSSAQADVATVDDLNGVLGTYATDQRNRGAGPTLPSGNPTPAPPQSGSPDVDQTPSAAPGNPIAPVDPPAMPNVPATPAGPVTPPAIIPPAPVIPVTPPVTTVPVVAPMPGDDDDDHDNGHGNDDDGDDDSNPGKGRGKKRR